MVVYLTLPPLFHSEIQSSVISLLAVEKIKLKIDGLSSSQSQLGTFALVLGEEDGNRKLPIIIGGFEAQAIALEMENIKSNRPMTHDLLVSIAKSFDIDMIEVVITDLKEGVFYSKIIFVMGEETREIDARPSDAIAVAVRYRAPIYTYESILSEAGLVIRDAPTATSTKTSTATAKTEEKPAQTKDEMVRRLKEKIADAISKEDYEEAARLRDQIDKLGEH
jgi:bifunctional DNase/RNase